MDSHSEPPQSDKIQDIKKQVMADLSAVDFKDKILAWFKERGLLSKMRTHLRYQMIAYLRETEIGNVLAESQPKKFNSKIRAVHFLVAEFLLHSHHHYSLSILVSEAPFLNVFPEMTSAKNTPVEQEVFNSCITYKSPAL